MPDAWCMALAVSGRFTCLGGDLMARSFQDLRVWQAAMDLAVDLAAPTERFPRHCQWLAHQIKSSSESGPSNIAEGFERRLNGDSAKFLRIAKASIGETESHLTYAWRMRLINDEEHSRFAEARTCVEKMLDQLISHLLSRAER